MLVYYSATSLLVLCLFPHGPNGLLFCFLLRGLGGQLKRRSRSGLCCLVCLPLGLPLHRCLLLLLPLDLVSRHFCLVLLGARLRICFFAAATAVRLAASSSLHTSLSALPFVILPMTLLPGVRDAQNALNTISTVILFARGPAGRKASCTPAT